MFLTVAVCCCADQNVEQFRLPSLIIRQGQTGTCIFDTTCNRQSKETVTRRKHVTKHSKIDCPISQKMRESLH